VYSQALRLPPQSYHFPIEASGCLSPSPRPNSLPPPPPPPPSCPIQTGSTESYQMSRRNSSICWPILSSEPVVIRFSSSVLPFLLQRLFLLGVPLLGLLHGEGVCSCVIRCPVSDYLGESDLFGSKCDSGIVRRCRLVQFRTMSRNTEESLILINCSRSVDRGFTL
jgi:hypothetical protein